MLKPLYSIATVLAQPFLRRKLRRRGADEPGYLHAVPERFCPTLRCRSHL